METLANPFIIYLVMQAEQFARMFGGLALGIAIFSIILLGVAFFANIVTEGENFRVPSWPFKFLLIAWLVSGFLSKAIPNQNTLIAMIGIPMLAEGVTDLRKAYGDEFGEYLGLLLKKHKEEMRKTLQENS